MMETKTALHEHLKLKLYGQTEYQMKNYDVGISNIKAINEAEVSLLVIIIHHIIHIYGSFNFVAWEKKKEGKRDYIKMQV